MRNLRSLAFALVVPASLLLAGCAGSIDDGDADVQTVGQGLVSAKRPLAGYVLTPHGYYHESCVAELADDAMAEALAPCAYPRLVLRSDATTAAAATTNGWVTAVSVISSVDPVVPRRTKSSPLAFDHSAS